MPRSGRGERTGTGASWGSVSALQGEGSWSWAMGMLHHKGMHLTPPNCTLKAVRMVNVMSCVFNLSEKRTSLGKEKQVSVSGRCAVPENCLWADTRRCPCSPPHWKGQAQATDGIGAGHAQRLPWLEAEGGGCERSPVQPCHLRAAQPWAPCPPCCPPPSAN